jgi:hypothetical protein
MACGDVPAYLDAMMRGRRVFAKVVIAATNPEKWVFAERSPTLSPCEIVDHGVVDDTHIKIEATVNTS